MSLTHTKDVAKTVAQRVARPTILEVVSDRDARADLTAASDVRFGLGSAFDAHLARVGDSCPPIVGHHDTHWLSGEGDALEADLASLFARLPVDIVHTHRVEDLAVVGAAAREAGVPCIAHTICGEFALAENGRIDQMRDLAATLDVTLIAPSVDVACRLGSLDDIAIIPRSIDCTRFRPESPAKARQKIGLPEGPEFIGCASPAEGLETLFHVLRRLDPDVHLALFGPASPGLVERSTIRELNLEERVHVLGGWASPELIYQAIDVYYHGPSYDCSPRPVLAAQACEKPVVAAYPTQAEYICPRTGHLLPAQFQPALASALTQALSRSPATTAREFVETNWNLSASIELYESVLRSAVSRSLRGRGAGEGAAIPTAG